jgi:hypothetical protein
MNQIEDERFDIVALAPDKSEQSVQVIELGRLQSKIVSNVAMVVSKQMTDSK